MTSLFFPVANFDEAMSTKYWGIKSVMQVYCVHLSHIARMSSTERLSQRGKIIRYLQIPLEKRGKTKQNAEIQQNMNYIKRQNLTMEQLWLKDFKYLHPFSKYLIH